MPIHTIATKIKKRKKKKSKQNKKDGGKAGHNNSNDKNEPLLANKDEIYINDNDSYGGNKNITIVTNKTEATTHTKSNKAHVTPKNADTTMSGNEDNEESMFGKGKEPKRLTPSEESSGNSESDIF